MSQTNVLLAQLVVTGNKTNIAAEAVTQSFHPSETAVVVNTLWFTSLAASLVSALLASLIQDWMRHFLRARDRAASANLEQQCLQRMRAHMGAQRYGLYQGASLVAGLMHVAVLVLLAGLGLFLSFLESFLLSWPRQALPCPYRAAWSTT